MSSSHSSCSQDDFENICTHLLTSYKQTTGFFSQSRLLLVLEEFGFSLTKHSLLSIAYFIRLIEWLQLNRSHVHYSKVMFFIKNGYLKLENIFSEAIYQLPQAKPAIKSNVGALVATQFQLPVVISAQQPN